MNPKPPPDPTFDPALRQWAVGLFEALRRLSHDGVGISRPSYGAAETAAIQVIADAALAEGLEVEYDGAANMVVSLTGQRPELPFAACGSHLDSVPRGGNFDGAAGVIGGLAGMVALKRAGVVPPRTLKLFVLRGEESAWFSVAYLGSTALFGDFDGANLDRPQAASGETLAQCMRACGVDIGLVAGGEPLVRAEDFACFLELHIEQGPVMVARDVPVAVVTGIRGNIRHPKAVCRGEAAHSGAVPRWLRHDAVFAVSDLVMRLDGHWRALLEQGRDLVVTVGIVGTNAAEHAMTRVPGEVAFSFEYRSQSEDVLAAFGALLAEEAADVGRGRGVVFELGPPVATAPASTHPALVESLAGICKARGIAHDILPSGAGHDAAIFANQGIPTGMVFIRNAHGSHNPNESMDFDDFFLGAEVLLHGLLTVPEVLA